MADHPNLVAALAAVASGKTQAEVARCYARIVWRLYLRPVEVVPVAALNRAIMDRWSKAGLLRIKHKAWKIADAAAKAGRHPDEAPLPLGGQAP